MSKSNSDANKKGKRKAQVSNRLALPWVHPYSETYIPHSMSTAPTQQQRHWLLSEWKQKNLHQYALRVLMAENESEWKRERLSDAYIHFI